MEIRKKEETEEIGKMEETGEVVKMEETGKVGEKEETGEVEVKGKMEVKRGTRRREREMQGALEEKIKKSPQFRDQGTSTS